MKKIMLRMRKKLVILVGFLAFSAYAFTAIHTTAIQPLKETEVNSEWCESIGGEVEVKVNYTIKGKNHNIWIDCLTKTHAIESGFDANSSKDSMHQALFASELTGLKPKIVIFSRNPNTSPTEYQLKILCKNQGIEYQNIALPLQ